MELLFFIIDNTFIENVRVLNFYRHDCLSCFNKFPADDLESDVTVCAVKCQLLAVSWIQSDRWAPRWAELSGLKSHHQPLPNYWVIFISRWQMSQLHHQQLCPLSHHCLNNFLPKRKIEFVKWWKEQLQSPRRHTHTHTDPPHHPSQRGSMRSLKMEKEQCDNSCLYLICIQTQSCLGISTMEAITEIGRKCQTIICLTMGWKVTLTNEKKIP